MVHYVVIGGGVAGIACVQELLRFITSTPVSSTGSSKDNHYRSLSNSSLSLSLSSRVTLVSASSTVKGIKNYVKVSDNLESFDIEDKALSSLQDEYGSDLLQVIQGIVSTIVPERKEIFIQLSSSSSSTTVPLYPTMTLGYDKLCLCTGASPRLILRNPSSSTSAHPLIMGLRDTTSVETLARYLLQRSIQRIAIIGNGGIALGLVYELSVLNKQLAGSSASSFRIPEILWGIKDTYIGNTFFDASASHFFLSDPDLGIHIVRPDETGTDTMRNGNAPLPTASSSLLLPIANGYSDNTTSSSSMTDNENDYHLPPSLTSTETKDANVPPLSSLSSKSTVSSYPNASLTGNFVPLPPRNRRKRGRNEKVSSFSQIPKTSEEDESTLAANTKGKEATEKESDTVPLSSDTSTVTSATPAYGSSLGPTWVSTLRDWLTNTKDNDTMNSNPNTIPTNSELYPDQPNTSSSSLSVNTRIVLETGVEIYALRGTGSLGAHNQLADEEWHTIEELTTDNSLTTTLPNSVPSNVLPSSSSAAVSSSSAFTDSINDNDSFPLHIQFTNQRIYGVDLLISATGVLPVTHMLPRTASLVDAPSSLLSLSPTLSPQFFNPQSIFYIHNDGGLIVNRHMQTTGSEDIYAAGDVAAVLWPRMIHHHHHSCTASSSSHHPSLWFQMRLWNQARIEGSYTARCMLDRLDPLEADDGGMTYEIFAHMTKFLNKKVVLLGLYNGQGLGTDYELALRTSFVTAKGMDKVENNRTNYIQNLEETTTMDTGDERSNQRSNPKKKKKTSPVQVQLRITPGHEYCKIVILHGRVVGAMLIGDTDLEETMEHLILNQLDIRKKKGIRQPAVRVEEEGNVTKKDNDEEKEEDEPLDLLDPDIDIEDYFD